MEAKELIFLLEKLNAMEASIASLFKAAQTPQKEPHRSAQIDLIASALAKAQTAFKPLKASGNSIDGAFSDIEDITDAVATALASYGLKLYQHTQPEDGQCMLVTELIHDSGQWISSKMQLIISQTDKETAAHLDFHKRHQALTLLGWHANEKVYDDNGDWQYENNLINKIKNPSKVVAEKKHWITITKEQHDDLVETIQDYPELAKDIMERYGITSLKDMPKQDFPTDMKRIREIIFNIKKR